MGNSKVALIAVVPAEPRSDNSAAFDGGLASGYTGTAQANQPTLIGRRSKSDELPNHDQGTKSNGCDQHRNLHCKIDLAFVVHGTRRNRVPLPVCAGNDGELSKMIAARCGRGGG